MKMNTSKNVEGKTKINRFFPLIISLVLALGITTACSTIGSAIDQETTDTTKLESVKPTESIIPDKPDDIDEPDNNLVIDNSGVSITMLEQDYNDGNIVEILAVSYDENATGLEQYDGKNPEIDSLNNAICSSLLQKYNDYLESGYLEDWIMIKSYPFTSADYVQIVSTYALYPTYGSEGEVYSYNFDMKNNRFISVEDVLSELSTNESAIFGEVNELIKQEFDDGSEASEVTIGGFLIQGNEEDKHVQLLLDVEIIHPSGDAESRLYSYMPQFGELIKLNPECLFDPVDMDQMNPPLSYQSDFEQADIPDNDSLQLTIDLSGLEEIIPSYEYAYDGMVYYTIEQLERAASDERSIVEAIQELEASAISISNATESIEHLGLLGYPCWLVTYDEGSNEDTVSCMDIYVQTDDYDYRLHSSVSADFYLDYHDEIGQRLGSVHWLD